MSGQTEQLTLSFDRAARERDVALERIDRVTSDDFRERAERFVLAYLGAHGATPGEVLVEKCGSVGGLRPTDLRHFGTVFRSLSMRGVIVCVGYCNRARGHSTAGGRIWELAEGGE